MPLYIGDYLKDTQDLSRAEHGTYLLVMMAYWSDGESLPDHKFRSICGKEFGRVSHFFSLESGRWHHKRIDEELEKARNRMAASKLKSRLGVLARRRKSLPQAGESEYDRAARNGASPEELEEIVARHLPNHNHHP